MFLKLFNHRDFESRKFIFQNAPAAPAEAEQPEPKKAIEAFEKDFFEGMKLPKEPENIKKFVDEVFTKKFSPEKYESELKNFISKYKIDENKANRLVSNAVNRYKMAYEAALARFYRIAEARASDYVDMTESIRKSTRRDLDKLRADVEATRRAEGAKPAPETVPTPAGKGERWPYKIPILGPVFREADIPIISRLIDSKDYREYKKFQVETTEKYREFISAMNVQYFESKQYAEKLSGLSKKEYDKLSSRFKKGVEEHMKNQLEFIFKNSKDAATLKSNLEGLRDKLVAYYKLYDTNNDGILDFNELKNLDRDTNQVRVAEVVSMTEDDAELDKKLEALNFYNNEVWQNAVVMMTEQLLTEAVRSGAETAVIEFVKKLTGKKDLNFDKAAEMFRDIIKKLAKTGVKETLSVIREFNKAANEGRAELLEMENIQPKAIRVLVHRQRALILEKRLVPQNTDDRNVAEFMSSNLVGRTMILNDPDRKQALFQAIQNIKKHYSEWYDKMPQGYKQKKDVSTRTAHPESPTEDDLNARMIAMLTLAKEAEWVIRNLDKTKDNRGKKIAEKLDDTQAEEAPPKMDRKFRSVDTLYRTGYVSEAERGGFNGKSIVLGAVKVWAGLTLVLNFMNARKILSKEGQELGWIKGAGAMLTNPYFLGGAAAIYGIHKYQENPAAKNYFFMDAGGQERLSTHLSLGSLAKKEGKGRVITFVCNSDEFNAMKFIMKKPQEGASNVQKLLKTAEERATKEKKKEPVLTKDDLKDYVDTKTWALLPSGGDDRMRFLFYKSFLTSARNVRQLEEDCRKWI